MSLPYCLTNPKLRRVETGSGWVVLERRAPQDYNVFKDGVRLGRVTKFKSWFADGDETPHRTRMAAIDAVFAAQANKEGERT